MAISAQKDAIKMKLRTKEELRNMRRNISTSVLFLLIFFMFAGCEKAGSPVLTEIGPIKTKAGVKFNLQPSGEAAMWVHAQNVTDTTVIVWGERQLRTDKQPYGASAGVPGELYAKPGQFQIHLLDTKTGVKSNSLTFVVE